MNSDFSPSASDGDTEFGGPKLTQKQDPQCQDKAEANQKEDEQLRQQYLDKKEYMRKQKLKAFRGKDPHVAKPRIYPLSAPSCMPNMQVESITKTTTPC